MITVPTQNHEFVCTNCLGTKIPPNKMDRENGPICGCGKPSKKESGSCGEEDCDVTCKECTE